MPPGLEGPFDLIVVDADTSRNPACLTRALRLSRPGTPIVGDTVVRGGAVTEAGSADATVQGVRRFLRAIADEPRLEAAALQTVGEKGRDGVLLARVCAPLPPSRPVRRDSPPGARAPRHSRAPGRG